MTDKIRKHSSAKYATAMILFLLLAITGIGYVLHWSFTIDDAAISFSYARNFAQGYGLGALYPGAPRVEGYSNLLWVILLAVGTKLGLETLLVSKILGLLFSLGSMAVLFFCLRNFIHSQWLLLGVALLPISLTFSFWSASGLENSFYVFLILLSVYFLIREDRDSWFPAGSALALILVGMTRPEGIIYIFAALAYKVLQLAISIFWPITKQQSAISLQPSRITKHALLRNLLVWLAITVLGYGLFMGWRYWYFAAWWPNPIYAKAGWYKTDLYRIFLAPEGWVYLRGYFRTFAALWLIPALVFGGIVSLRGRQRVFPIFALVALALPLLTSDWMVNYRFLYPFLPFQTALLIMAADQLVVWMLAKAHRPAWLRIVAVGLTIWFAFGVARYAWANLRITQRQLACGYAPFAEMRCLDGKMYWTMGEVDQKYSELEIFADQLGLDDPLYMIPDIGATSYLHNKRILDLAGLGDYHMARIRDGALLKQYIFNERRPDLIMTYGVWTRRTDLTAFSAFAENYLPIEKGQDEDGRINGTFVRKDLLINRFGDDAVDLNPTDAKGIENIAKEVAPGLYSLALPAVNLVDRDKDNHTTGFDTFWYARQPQTEELSYQIKLTNSAGQVIYEQSAPLGYGWYPTTLWKTGDLFRQHIQLPENLPEDEYTFQLTLVGSDEAIIYILQPSTFNYQKNPLPESPRVETHTLGREFYRAAQQVAKKPPVNWGEAYKLYLAAWLADPDNAWAQRGLEYARRMAKL